MTTNGEPIIILEYYKTEIIIILLLILCIIIYLSFFYSNSLTKKYEEIRESLHSWFFSLFVSNDGKTLMTKKIL